MSSPSSSPSSGPPLAATVIGLGAMGITLARLLLRAGYRVTVWNRSPDKAQPLIEQGAILAGSAAEAMAAHRLVVMCVYDYTAAAAILGAPGVSAAASDRVIVHLSTGSAQDARDTEAWAHRHGAAYLDGAIQAAPSQMAAPDTTLLISGAPEAFTESQALLKVFGGNIKYLGHEIGGAATLDLASLSYVYGATIGVLHGARILEAERVSLVEYGTLLSEIAPSFGLFLKHEVNVIHSGDFAITESPLRISVEATARLLQSARAAQINQEFPALAASLFERAKAAGYNDEEAAAVIKVLRAS